MSKNERIREHLIATALNRRSKNCFWFKNVEIKIDIGGYRDHVRVSVYNPNTDTDMIFYVPVSEVEFIEDALTD